MKNDISKRDLELLSTYLDNELNPKDRARVEERLQTNPQLRSILGELHQNRAALRSLPRLRAPRNFTLTPEIAGIKPKKSTYPVFGLVSALSSLLLILVFVGDYLIKPALPVIPSSSVQPAMLEVPVEGAEDMEVLMEKGIEELEVTQVVEEPAMAAQAESAMETDSMALRGEQATEEAVEQAPDEVEVFSSMMPQGTTTPSPEAYSITQTPTPTYSPPTSTPTLYLPTATLESHIEELIESVVPSTPTTVEPQPETTTVSYVRILEILLAAITLISGLVALYLRTKSM